MKSILSRVLPLTLAAALPAAALAETSVTAGVTLASRYVSNGLEQSNGPAIQPWVEVETNGIYFGLWASNTSRGLVGARAEVDLSFGWRGESGALSYDIGYARYFYFSPDDNCCGEVILNLGYAPSDTFSLGLKVAYDPEAHVTNASASAGFSLSDQIGLEITAGSISDGGQSYWSAGGSYALSDSLSVSAAYHDTDISGGVAVLALDYSFSLR